MPENYQVLFLQGGASLQFSMIPMNLLPRRRQTADYIITGSWGKKAVKEAKRVRHTQRRRRHRRRRLYIAPPAQDELKLDRERGLRSFHLERDD